MRKSARRPPLPSRVHGRLDLRKARAVEEPCVAVRRAAHGNTNALVQALLVVLLDQPRILYVLYLLYI